jgi:prepilin-type N-terminal cleavage/methylation domain-containing protein
MRWRSALCQGFAENPPGVDGWPRGICVNAVDSLAGDEGTAFVDLTRQMDARSTRCPSQSGFTLIELLTVVAIIGVLAVVALQQLESYRRAGFDARALSDLKNAVSAEEAYFATTRNYMTLNASGPGPSALPGLMLSDTVTIDLAAVGDTFNGTSISTDGTGRVMRYDSALGWIGIP